MYFFFLDNLRTHNAVVKKQYDALAEWRKKENDKFEQTKALITALRADNQELQVKVMTLVDKEVSIDFYFLFFSQYFYPDLLLAF